VIPFYMIEGPNMEEKSRSIAPTHPAARATSPSSSLAKSSSLTLRKPKFQHTVESRCGQVRLQRPQLVVLDPIFVSRDVPISVEHIRLVPWEFASPVSISFNGIVPELLVAQAADVVHESEKIRIEEFIRTRDYRCFRAQGGIFRRVGPQL
jgi:hypothetical protein